MITKKLSMAVTAIVLVFGVATSTASAQTGKLVDPLGAEVPNGSTVRGGPSTATLTTSLGNITCSLSLRGTYNALPNPRTVSVTVLNWTGCTDTIPLFNVCSATTNGLPGTPITATLGATTATGGTVTLANTNVTVTLCGGLGTCQYGASVTSTVNNAANTLSVNQAVPRTGGTFFSCPANGTFTVTLTPMWIDVDNNGVYNNPPDYRVRMLCCTP